MLSRNNWPDFRILVVAGFFFGACGYEPPSVGSGSTSSSSSSSGMGGAGGKEPTGSVSSSGEGGVGGSPSGAGGVGGVGGVGGLGGGSVTSSSSGTGMDGGGVPESVVDCINKPCDTTGPGICCLPPALPTLSYCSDDGSCVPTDYRIDCDDKADCPELFCCFDMSANTSACNKDTCQKIICKTDFDCPMSKPCGPQMGFFRFCNP